MDLPPDLLREAVLITHGKPPCVHHSEQGIVPDCLSKMAIAGNAGKIIHQGLPAAGHAIE